MRERGEREGGGSECVRERKRERIELLRQIMETEGRMKHCKIHKHILYLF